MIINKKEYNSSIFVPKFHETYFNLNIYPILNELETIAGLMSDLAEMYNELMNGKVNYKVIANERKQFIIDNLHNFDNGTPSSKQIIYYESRNC